MEVLDARQYKAATNKSQYVLCDSKAGSGKTKTLMNRCLYLMENGVKPQEIMLVTFTNKAAQEMMTRIRRLSPDGDRILCGTFHNLALTFLRRYSTLVGFDPSFTILSPDDGEKIMKDIIKSTCKVMAIDEDRAKALKANKILSEYSASRNKDIPLTEYLESRQYVLGLIPIITDMIETYETRKQINELMDFDDLLFYFNAILQFDEVKKYMHGTFKHILVDEFQDVNNVQFAIVNSLAGKNGSIFAVGDPYQCIYGFRGSNIEYIDSFEDMFDASVVHLDNNYRSTQEILDLGAEVTKGRAKMKAHLGYGKKPQLCVARSTYGNAANEHIAQDVAGRVKALINDGVSPTEIAILARSTNQIQLVEAELKKRGIAYVMRAGFSYFEKAHIKDVLSFLSITVNKKNREGLTRTLGLFKGFGPKAIKTFVDTYIDNGCDMQFINDMVNDRSLKLTKTCKEGFSTFYSLYMKVSAEPSIEKKVTTFVRDFYRDYVTKEFIDDAEVRLSEVETLIHMSKKYSKLEEFINDVMVDTSINNKETGTQKQEKIVISTIHRAKGLEWDHVFICNMEPLYRVTPRPRDEEDTFVISEDARLLYVAITRARKDLRIYCTSTDLNNRIANSVNLSYLLADVSGVNRRWL